GMAGQLVAAGVLVCRMAWVLARRSGFRQLLPAWVGAGLIGATANASIYYLELTRHGLPPPLFNPTFPRDLVLFLVGAPVLLPVGLWLATALLGVWVLRTRLWLWTTVGVVAAAVLVLWLVIQPAFLYPRFLVFLVPGIAYLMAAAVRRWWVLAPVVLIGAGAAVFGQATDYLKDPLALPQAAAAVELERELVRGGRWRSGCRGGSAGRPGRRAPACGRSASKRPPRRSPREGLPSAAPLAPSGGASNT